MLEELRAYSEKPLIDRERYLLSLKKAGLLPKRAIPDKIILLMTPSVIHLLRKNNVGMERAPFFTGEIDFLGELGIVHRIGFGGPSAALFLEKLIALGAKELVIVGTAGALSAAEAGDSLNVGDKIVVPWALRDDGVSDQYLPKNKKVSAHRNLSDRLQVQLQKDGVAFQAAPVWTTDSFYRETVSSMKKAVELGAKAVEMEAASVFAVCEHHQCAAAALLVVSDVLKEDDWAPQFHEIGDALLQAVQAAVKALAKGHS